MKPILQQLKERRLALGLKQNDMMLRAGFSRQQYQRLEANGNPRLDTLELIAKGLNCEIMLIPTEKLNAVTAALESTDAKPTHQFQKENNVQKSLSDNPWQDLLEDDAK